MNLATTAALVILGATSLLWLLSLARRDASIVDIFWGLGFVIIACVGYVGGQGSPGRKALLLTLVALWGIRLAGYLFWRNGGKGEDYRYQAMRARFGPGFWWISLFYVFYLQGTLMMIIATPLLAGFSRGPEALGLLDYAGTLLWAVGLTFEAVGDWQLARFKANPANRGKVLQSGLWRYTRHPNYFGDAVVWWGYGLIGLAAGAWWAVVGPALMTFLLLRVSGVSLLERSLTQTKPGYAKYVRSTSPFFPLPPRRLRA